MTCIGGFKGLVTAQHAGRALGRRQHGRLLLCALVLVDGVDDDLVQGYSVLLRTLSKYFGNYNGLFKSMLAPLACGAAVFWL